MKNKMENNKNKVWVIDLILSDLESKGYITLNQSLTDIIKYLQDKFKGGEV